MSDLKRRDGCGTRAEGQGDCTMVDGLPNLGSATKQKGKEEYKAEEKTSQAVDPEQGRGR
jgi:hypothetical protein